jgi:hypothetical protein
VNVEAKGTRYLENVSLFFNKRRISNQSYVLSVLSKSSLIREKSNCTIFTIDSRKPLIPESQALVLSSVYLLYWYKSTNTDTCGAASQAKQSRVNPPLFVSRLRRGCHASVHNKRFLGVCLRARMPLKIYLDWRGD